jgi:hypothetical protein
MDVSEMTKEQLAQKLFTYQQFMAKYIVDSQQQKVKAIAAAEMKVKQQYEEKLLLLSGSSTTVVSRAPANASPAFEQRSAKVAAAAAAGKSRWGDMENRKVGASAVGVVNGAVAAVAPAFRDAVNVNFEKRNSMVAAAGKAGKSRWGEAEVAKASSRVSTLLPAAAPSTSSAPAATAPVTLEVPPEVQAADHGLRADGGVGGPSLAERINFGAQLISGQKASAVPAPLGSTTTTPASSTYFSMRNAMIAAAGLAGKSRWGEMEIQKARSLLASLPSSSNGASAVDAVTIKISPEIEAADHGLRADGGVGGPTLAQRVNLGASLVGM